MGAGKSPSVPITPRPPRLVAAALGPGAAAQLELGQTVAEALQGSRAPVAGNVQESFACAASSPAPGRKRGARRYSGAAGYAESDLWTGDRCQTHFVSSAPRQLAANQRGLSSPFD